ncbi:hypothetical protein Tco_0669809 [Tanacetum coccineum]
MTGYEGLQKLMKVVVWFEESVYTAVTSQRMNDELAKRSPRASDKGYAEEDNEHEKTLCGSCKGKSSGDKF